MHNPIASALAVVTMKFPDCYAALLAGSVVRGDATDTSDLDIVIITGHEDAPYRESFFWEDWPVEVFVHTEQSLLDFFGRDARRYRPSLQQMCLEGYVLRDHAGLTTRIKDEARRQLELGPGTLAPEDLERRRYMVTDLLDDFSGSVHLDESYFVAHDLADACVQLLLLNNRRWLGSGKWTIRALRAYDPALAEQLTNALERFYKLGDKTELVAFGESVLETVGGRLFHGYQSPRKTK